MGSKGVLGLANLFAQACNAPVSIILMNTRQPCKGWLCEITSLEPKVLTMLKARQNKRAIVRVRVDAKVAQGV